MDPAASRRRFLRYLAASPLLAASVFDFEPVMHRNVLPAHFGRMATGIDDEVTLRANREGLLRAAMMQMGAPSLKHLVPAMVRRA